MSRLKWTGSDSAAPRGGRDRPDGENQPRHKTDETSGRGGGKTKRRVVERVTVGIAYVPWTRTKGAGSKRGGSYDIYYLYPAFNVSTGIPRNRRFLITLRLRRVRIEPISDSSKIRQNGMTHDFRSGPGRAVRADHHGPTGDTTPHASSTGFLCLRCFLTGLEFSILLIRPEARSSRSKRLPKRRSFSLPVRKGRHSCA